MDITVNHTVNAPGSIPAPVHRWVPGDATGNPVTAWVDGVGSLSATATGTPPVEASPSTATVVGFDDDGDYFTAATMGNCPTGSADRTIMGIAKLDIQAGTASWAGLLGYGDGTNNRCFSVIVTGDTHLLAADLRSDILEGPSLNQGQVFTFAGTYSQSEGLVRLYYNGQETGSSPFERPGINTVTSGQVNIMRSFTAQGRAGWIGECSVFAATLTPTQIAAEHDRLLAAYVNDTTGPTLSSATLTATGTTTATAGVTTDDAEASHWVVVTASATKPTPAQIRQGQDNTGTSAPAAGPLTGGTSLSVPITGIPTGQVSYAHWTARDASGNEAENADGVITSASAALPGTAPAPASITPTSFTAQETAQVGDTVATLVAKDSGGNNLSVTWSEGTPNNTSFNISSTTGQVTVASALSEGSSTFKAVATNDGGSVSQDVTATVTVTTPLPGMDYSETNWTGVQSLITGWGGNVPLNRAVVVEVQNPQTADINLSNQTLSHQVTIRPAPGTFGMSVNSGKVHTPTNPAKLSGTINLSGSTNIRLFSCQIESSAQVLNLNNTTDVTVENCLISGPPYDVENLAAATGTNPLTLCTMHGSTRLKMLNCVFAYFQEAVGRAFTSPTTDLQTEGCISVFTRKDDYKLDPGTGTIFRRNWSGRNRNIALGGHVDYVQGESGGSYVNNLLWGNVHLPGRWTGAGITAAQMFWLKDTAAFGAQIWNNLTVSQNVGVGSSTINALRLTAGVGSTATNCQSTYNSVIPAYWSQLTETTQSGYYTNFNVSNTIDYNIAIGPDMGGYAGPNGVLVVMNHATVDPDVFLSNNIENSGLFTARAESEDFDFGWALPPSSAVRSHWDNANPVGPHERLREIFVEGVHPGNNRWPVDAVWTALYNMNGGVTSGFTGTVVGGVVTGSYNNQGTPV